MADLDLWTENSTLSNFADDTQSIIVRENKKNLLETASSEAKCVIDFFRSNGLVNNADKAAVLYNGKGKSEIITVENVGGGVPIITSWVIITLPTVKASDYPPISFNLKKSWV